ncbi:MAG: glycoside hydrolase family 140 protein, partial [Candidatus Yonathbacteria bacterium]|nr:glycoside hydrolase family 140 protein [Candidatus Yonathbacteria bacterium]
LDEGINISRYMLARYGAYNIIWSLTGEFQYAAENNNHWFWNNYADTRTLGNAVEAHNPYGHPVSIHPGGCGGDNASTLGGCGGSSSYFHNEAWLDNNWIQTHFTWEAIPGTIREAYDRSPTKPVIQSEPCYEGMTGGWSPFYGTRGECTSYLARMQGWISMLSGAAGYVYGADGLYYADNWNSLSLPGSTAVGYMKSFFTSLPQWWLMTPTLDCVSLDGVTLVNDNMSHPRCAGVAGSFYAAYLPEDMSGTPRFRNITNGTYRARWYNPRTGNYTTINNALPVTSQWGIPARPDGSDWVVIIDK